MFQQVIGHQNHRNIHQEFFTDSFTADSALQLRKVQGPVVFPGQDLSIDHGTVRQSGGGGFDFRVFGGHQFFAPGPDEDPAFSLDNLGPDAVPFPLGLPLLNIAQFFDVLV